MYIHRLLMCTLALIIAFKNMECSEEDMYKITGYQFDWRRVGRRLLSDQNVRDIDIEGGSEREKRDKMLIEWKRTKSRNATYQALVKELRAIGNNATADRVEELEWKNKQQGMCNLTSSCAKLMITFISVLINKQKRSLRIRPESHIN